MSRIDEIEAKHQSDGFSLWDPEDVGYLLTRNRSLEARQADLIKRLEAIEAIEPVGGDVVGAYSAVKRMATAAIVMALAGGES